MILTEHLYYYYLIMSYLIEWYLTVLYSYTVLYGCFYYISLIFNSIIYYYVSHLNVFCIVALEK